MFIHDLIKIEYVKQGYLPNYPYHLISDKEMFTAFLDMNAVTADYLKNYSNLRISWSIPSKQYLEDEYYKYDEYKNDSYVTLHWADVPGATMYSINIHRIASSTELEHEQQIIKENSNHLTMKFNGTHVVEICVHVGAEVIKTGFAVITENTTGNNQDTKDCHFLSMYPCPCYNNNITTAYYKLVDSMNYHINQYLLSNDADKYRIPDWVYSYMLGTVVGPSSSQLDRHDLLVLLNKDNMDDVIDEQVMEACLEVSENWIRRLQPEDKVNRPPTMFGEPHVVKSLRLSQ